jgi:hypothetical protein
LALLLAGLLAHLLLILLAGALLSRTLLARLLVVVRHFSFLMELFSTNCSRELIVPHGEQNR